MSEKIKPKGGLRSSIENEEFKDLISIYENSRLSTAEKLENFPLFIRRQNLTRLIALYEIFKKIINIKGSIIECGVNNGFGLMSWHKFSSILEPVNLTRRIYGFDTFEGFPSVSDNDKSKQSDHIAKGDLMANSFDELNLLIANSDKSRYLGHVPKTQIIKGDVVETIPMFLDDNPHLLVSLLFLDFDLYEPTMVALENLYPRMPKGSIIAFDELDNPLWPGETKAMLEFFKDNKLKILRTEFDPYIGFAEVGA